MSNSLKLILRTAWLPFAWLMLSGIERGKKLDNSFTLSDLQATYDEPAVIPTEFYFLLAFVIAAGVGGFFLLRYIRAKQEQEELAVVELDQQDQEMMEQLILVGAVVAAMEEIMAITAITDTQTTTVTTTGSTCRMAWATPTW